MTVPDKYIRKAYFNLLSGLIIGSIPVPVYDKRVPKSVEPVPPYRVIINSQTNDQANTSKGGHDWKASIELDVIAEFSLGNADSAIVNDIEQQINDLIDIQGDIDCPPFTIWNTQVTNPMDIVMDTKTKTIIRKILRYTHVLGD
jgi:hypothetical protein